MTDGTAEDGRTDLVDWTRIERSPEFRELTSRRHRFVATLAGVTFVTFGVYLGLATFASSLMGTTVGGVPIAWLAAMSQVVMTWAITWLYLRKADREFVPLEQAVAERASARFTREEAADEAPATTVEPAMERSPR